MWFRGAGFHFYSDVVPGCNKPPAPGAAEAFDLEASGSMIIDF